MTCQRFVRRHRLACVSALAVIAAMGATSLEEGNRRASVEQGRYVPTAGRAQLTEAAALPAGVGVDWWSQVQEEIRRSEYCVSWQEKTVLGDVPAAFQAPNRKHNLRTYFTADGIRVVPRTGQSAWQWGLKLVGYGREGAVGAAPTVKETTSKGNRMEYKRGDLTEWYVNDAKGLEQGFTIAEWPGGGPAERRSARRTLRVEMEVTGDLRGAMNRDEKSVEFTTGGGVRVLEFGQLAVCDARGRRLPGRFELADKRLSIVVDDAGAEYPVTIDPLATSPSWTAEGDQENARFGYSVSTAGDVNGDGYGDVIVGVPYYDNGQPYEGRAYVYHGGPSGLSVLANWSAESNQTEARFGCSVSTAGDVNGDGYSDVIVGAPYYDNGQSYEGRAYVYHGSAAGLSETVAWTAESDQVGAEFGMSVSTAGDVNGDGYSDVVVGAPGYDNGQSYEGRAYVYHGSAAGLSETVAWTAESDQDGACFGNSVSTAGDVNGDGFSDVIVGAYAYTNGQTEEGRAFVYHGGAWGLSATPDWTADGAQEYAWCGYSVSTAGDVNGDGYGDVIVGVPGYSGDDTVVGRACVYHGGPSGLSGSTTWTAEGDQEYAFFGWSVSTAGDVNGDGYSDVVVGAPGCGNDQTDEGRAFVYRGSAAGLSATVNWTAEGDQAGADFGWSVSTAGDVNGDGYSDVIVGAPLYDNDQADEGRAYVYHGGASGLGEAAGWTGESDQADAWFGASVSTAGDVNGDGYSDVIVGVRNYDNGQPYEGRAYVYHGSASGLSTTPDWTAEGDQDGVCFGESVSTAGDVNGDGYSDVIVGAVGYDAGEHDEGRAYVYHGGASGLSTTANWTAESDQAGSQFGCSVSTAGDVNGDGYSDVIVGANWCDSGQSYEGRAFVYHGSAAGLSATVNWTAEGDQTGAEFGNSVSTAGDVNGDGYSDVIVGALYYGNGESGEGRAFVYQGSAAGLSETAAWTAESDQGGAFFGGSVSTAGDVNGDGYSDVIVGASYFDNGETDEGRAFVYHGGAWGLSATANWRAEGDQAGAKFGRSVSTAGDVNGDGYSDVIVGANYFDNDQVGEGRAFVYHGGPTGLSTTANWSAEGDQADALFGGSVSTAGDVNGDGYSDVIVGAVGYDAGEYDEGRAFVYYGNGGDGLDVRAQQRRADNVAPVGHLNASESLDSFRLAVLGRTPFGRGAVKLQWEVKPLGEPFDGTGLGESPYWFDTGTAGAELNDLVSGLNSNSVYHWRVRLRYRLSAPYMHHSRWISGHSNGWEEADVRTSRRTSFPLGDLDHDEDVDGFDFLTFANCYNGSDRAPLEACENPEANLDGDEDVDGFDFLTFANCYNGSDRVPLCE